MRVALVLIYPCGKARKPDRSERPKALVRVSPFPSPFDSARSVLAVKGPLRRFAPWNRSGPIWREALFTRERGWMSLVVGLLRVVWTGRKGTFRSYQLP